MASRTLLTRSRSEWFDAVCVLPRYERFSFVPSGSVSPASEGSRAVDAVYGSYCRVTGMYSTLPSAIPKPLPPLTPSSGSFGPEMRMIA